MPYLQVVISALMTLFVMGHASAFEIEVPSGLGDEVKFWESIFSKYSPEQCVFHDKDDLTKIYAVVKIGAAGEKSRKTTKQYTDAIQNGLLPLSGGEGHSESH